MKYRKDERKDEGKYWLVVGVDNVGHMGVVEINTASIKAKTRKGSRRDRT